LKNISQIEFFFIRKPKAKRLEGTFEDT